MIYHRPPPGTRFNQKGDYSIWNFKSLVVGWDIHSWKRVLSIAWYTGDKRIPKGQSRQKSARLPCQALSVYSFSGTRGSYSANDFPVLGNISSNQQFWYFSRVASFLPPHGQPTMGWDSYVQTKGPRIRSPCECYEKYTCIMCNPRPHKVVWHIFIGEEKHTRNACPQIRGWRIDWFQILFSAPLLRVCLWLYEGTRPASHWQGSELPSLQYINEACSVDFGTSSLSQINRSFSIVIVISCLAENWKSWRRRQILSTRRPRSLTLEVTMRYDWRAPIQFLHRYILTSIEITETCRSWCQSRSRKWNIQRSHAQGASQGFHLVNNPTLHSLLYRILLCYHERLWWIAHQQLTCEPLVSRFLPWWKRWNLGRYCYFHVPNWWCRFIAIRWTRSRYFWTKIWNVARMPLHYSRYDHSRSCNQRGRCKTIHGWSFLAWFWCQYRFRRWSHVCCWSFSPGISWCSHSHLQLLLVSSIWIFC